jgi:hypothetical protein
VVQSLAALVRPAQTTDDAAYRGGYSRQDGVVAVVIASAGSVQGNMVTRSPVRRGSRVGASGGAVDRLDDVEASQARHYAPSQRRSRTAIRATVEASWPAQQSARIGNQRWGREDLPPSCTERANPILIQDRWQTGHARDAKRPAQPSAEGRAAAATQPGASAAQGQQGRYLARSCRRPGGVVPVVEVGAAAAGPGRRFPSIPDGLAAQSSCRQPRPRRFRGNAS